MLGLLLRIGDSGVVVPPVVIDEGTVGGGIAYRKHAKIKDWRVENAKGRRKFIRELLDALDDDELPPQVAQVVEAQVKPKLERGRVTEETVKAINPAVLDRLEALLDDYADEERSAEMLLL